MTPRSSEPRPAGDQLPPILGRGPGGPAFFTSEPTRARDTRGTLRRIWAYLRQERALLLTTVVLVVVTSGLALLGPYWMGQAIDAYILKNDLRGLLRLLVWMASAYVLTSLLTWLQAYITAGVAQRAVRDIRNDLFQRLQVLPLRFFDRQPHGS